MCVPSGYRSGVKPRDTWRLCVCMVVLLGNAWVGAYRRCHTKWSDYGYVGSDLQIKHNRRSASVKSGHESRFGCCFLGSTVPSTHGIRFPRTACHCLQLANERKRPSFRRSRVAPNSGRSAFLSKRFDTAPANCRPSTVLRWRNDFSEQRTEGQPLNKDGKNQNNTRGG